MRVLCYFLGHEPFIYDALADGTKIRGCPRCGAYVRRETHDRQPHAIPAIWKCRLLEGVRASAISGGKAA